MISLNPYSIIGILGMLLIVFGLWRTSSGRWRHTSIWYELDTIVGASLIIIYQLHVHAYIMLPINLFLVYISFRGLSSFAERYAHVRKHISKSRKSKQK